MKFNTEFKKALATYKLFIMKITLSKIAFLVLVTISIFSCSSEDASATPGPTPVDIAQATAEYTYTDDETAVMDAINDYREGLGLNRLEKIDFVSIKSEEHNNYMISVGTISHNFFQARAEKIIQVLGAQNVGENLASNYSTTQAVMNAWIASESHKANLVGDYTHFGISIRKNAEGKKYYTNMFVKK